MIDFEDFPIAKNVLKHLLEIACSNILFSFNSKYHYQIDSMPMGSKLAPTMAAFAMDLVESRFDDLDIQLPELYCRYVDDCFAIFKRRMASNS